jgi:hypothetical protein
MGRFSAWRPKLVETGISPLVKQIAFSAVLVHIEGFQSFGFSGKASAVAVH